MGKFLGFIFFLCGLAAVYMWGVRPLTSGSAAIQNVPISIITRGSSTPVLSSEDQRAVSHTASAFLTDWHGANYGKMYDLLSAAAQHRIGRKKFVARYKAVMSEATASSVRGTLDTLQITGAEATIAFTTTMKTQAVGIIKQHNQMHLVFTKGRWGVDWYPALIFKQLEDPYVVHLMPLPARRGSILDRHGVPLAEEGQFVEVGVQPGLISDETQLLGYMSNWLNMDPRLIKTLYTLSWAQPDYFMPITTITQLQVDKAPAGLTSAENNGVRLRPTPGRIYPYASVASILLGYVNPSTGHGVSGLEQSLDTVLSGKPGLALLVMNQAHTMTAYTIAEHAARDGQDVHLSIDLREQQALERSIGTRKGAAVAIDPSNGQVLAMVSAPSYDPNRFEVGSATNGIGPNRSMFPRATLGLYPTGSIFKIVTMAAGLEKGGYRSDTLIDGPGIWYGLGASNPLHDWEASGHGTITLQEALTQSCDTCFYTVAKRLDGVDENILPQFARQFGFGIPTGIDHVGEAAGLVGDDAWKRKTYNDAWRTGDTVNLSIGQGYFLATPLQVASMLASVGDGGGIHTPQLVIAIGKTKIAPKLVGRLPVSPAHLQAIMRGMLGVTTETSGTAQFVFKGFDWQVAGKTGTAQNPGNAQPHAWFGAIAPYKSPRIALAIVLENGGEGSLVAGPVARQALQAYLDEVDPVVLGGAQPLSVPKG
jgi:penicillin-binding protein 2